MARMIRTALAAVVAAILLAAPAWAVGGTYTVVGATALQEQTVNEALAASSVNWSLVPRVTVRVLPTVPSEGQALPGQIQLAAPQLDMGRPTWWLVQHEFAHQVDYALLTDARRAELLRLFGLDVWRAPDTPHHLRGAEVFASSLAWLGWPSILNGPNRAEATTKLREFQTLLAKWGIMDAPKPVCTRVKVKRGYWHAKPHGAYKKRHWHRPVYRTVCR